MNRRSCVNCGEPLPSWSRADRRTCSVRCRVARQRRAGAAKRTPATLGTTSTLYGTAPGIAGVTSASRRSGAADEFGGVTDDSVLPRLASWLAEISAEAALDPPTESAVS
jgi:hypothetical protein